MDFPGNSQNPVGKSKPLQKQEVVKKEVVKVVSGPVVERKKPLGQRIKNIFFGGEFKNATRYIASDVLLPAFRNMVVDATSKGVERMIYGDASPRRRADYGRTRVQYNAPVDRDRYSRPKANLPDQANSSRRQDIGDIILISREEAELVVERMSDIIDKYDVASVADFYDLVGLPTTFIDNKWGWTDMQYVDIRQVREGYVIVLPPIESI